jgi:inositol-phosphate transport system permease protein
MAANDAVAGPALEARSNWPALARRAWRGRVSAQSAVLAFLIVVSVPIILPYFWMVVIAFTARTGGVSSDVLWTACAVVVPAVILYSIVHMAAASRTLRLGAGVVILAIAGTLLVELVGSRLHLDNFRFLTRSDFVEELRSKATSGAQFPSIWTAFANSLALALSQTVVILTVQRFSAATARTPRIPCDDPYHPHLPDAVLDSPAGHDRRRHAGARRHRASILYIRDERFF